ncbi:MAG: response regulator [Chloroflexota bacterium]
MTTLTPEEEKPLAFIVEDDFDAKIIFEQALKMAGFETEVIEDGQVAINRLSQTTPALVSLDLHLPSRSGDEILHYIRAKKHLKKVSVILTTADASKADSLQNEADLVLLKIEMAWQNLQICCHRCSWCWPNGLHDCRDSATLRSG